MKSRSHRLPTSEPHDDWGDGSWTVDCSCGVTFDDGEEMVSCDKCGVWVHTRCSRFVRGEASFSCHNCSKPNPNPPTAAAPEETEVAQLLVDLPMAHLPPRRRRLWAELPMEDRVHVQGPPGGDPALFQKAEKTEPATIFNANLWKACGYVPKKFNFQYKEFKSWEEDGGGEGPANLLFSLSKMRKGMSTMAESASRKRNEEVDRLAASMEMNMKVENDDGNTGSNESTKEEDANEAVDCMRQPMDESHNEVDLNEGSRQVVTDKNNSSAASGRPSVPYMQNPPDTDSAVLPSPKVQELSSKVQDVEMKFDVSDAQDLKNTKSLPSPAQLSRHQTSSGHSSDVFPEHETVTSLSSTEKKSRDTEKEALYPRRIHDKSTKVKKPHGQAVEESLNSPLASFMRPEDYASAKDEDSNPSEVVTHLQKPDASVGKPSLPRPPSTASSTSSKILHFGKQRVKGASLSIRDVPRSSTKGTKDSDHHGSKPSKPSQSSRIPQFSDSKDATLSQALSPSVKVSSAEETSVVVSGEKASIEKLNQESPQLPPRPINSSNTTTAAPGANAKTTLSDEELALLLHHELNSSPRVPRVPRLRQATGTGMQSAPPIAPSMLSKRSSSFSGGKDQVFRRKNREEAPKDISRNSPKVNETKRAGRGPFSPDRKYRESASGTDGSSKKDIRSPDSGASMRKKISGGGYDAENKSQASFESSGQNASSVRSSPRDVADGITSVAHRTLPVLLDEIISKGKCSTYRELCDAVRPHWNSLRKPNGDRYAYSSHSHAVLDCLRNRSEWAFLIERRTKTNSNKKRRKLESDTPDSDHSGREEGKKKVVDKPEESVKRSSAQKRRRSEMRGSRKSKLGISDSEDNDDDDDAVAAQSHSSNGPSSDDESQSGEDGTADAEGAASASSGDTDDA